MMLDLPTMTGPTDQAAATWVAQTAASPGGPERLLALLPHLIDTLATLHGSHPTVNLAADADQHPILQCPHCHATGTDLLVEWATSLHSSDTLLDAGQPPTLASGSDHGDSRIIGYLCTACTRPVSLPDTLDVTWS